MSKKYIAEPQHISISDQADYGFCAKLSVGSEFDDEESDEDSGYLELELNFWPHGDSGSMSLRIPYVDSEDIGAVIDHLYEIKTALKARESSKKSK